MTRACWAIISWAAWPRAWRMAIAACCTLILCSCQGPPQYGSGPPHLPLAPGTGWPGSQAANLPPEAYTGVPAAQPCPPDAALALGPPGMELGVPLPYEPTGPWAPPGIGRPWPSDEYLRDGGDRGLPAEVAPDREVRGLEMEDTVAHYDTIDGRTLVEPTNEVHIYSPRFGAVRQVVSLVENEQMRHSVGVFTPTKLTRYDEAQKTGLNTQNLQPTGQIGRKVAIAYQTRQGDGALSTTLGPKAFQNRFKPYENLSLIRQGIMVESEMAVLARGASAAVAWSHHQAVQVILDHQAAMAETSNQKLESVYTVKLPPGNPKLRLVKVASTQLAEPGDTVDFTIRFDNVGNQQIGNVTILDNLATRLEYVPDSAQSSVPAQFSTQPGEGNSLVLRWEISQPLPVGKGGIVRFSCRVR